MRMYKVWKTVRLSACLGAALALAGCSASSPSTDTAANKDAASSGGVLSHIVESNQPVTVPEGTVLHVVLDQSLASNRNHSGDAFEASTSAPVVVAGKTVIPKGAHVHGRVTEASESGRLSHVASLVLTLQSVEVGGKSYDLETNSVGRSGSNHNKRNVELIGGGTGVGALIGGLAGHGKGALIGGAVGAGAGTATAAATGKKDITIPAETPLSFRLARSIEISVKG